MKTYKQMITTAMILVIPAVVSGKLHFNVCNVRDPFSIVGPVSLKECMRSCKMVSDCTGITYTPRGLVCKIHDKFESQQDCPGSVAVPEDDFDVDINGNCTVGRCPPFATCDQETNKCVAQTVCRPPPTVSSSMIKGNMRTEGSNVKFTCNDGRVFISTCQPSGLWTEVPPCGRLTRLHVKHDNTGRGPGWYLDRINVSNMATSEMTVFPSEQWLGGSQTAKDLYPAVSRVNL